MVPDLCYFVFSLFPGVGERTTRQRLLLFCLFAFAAKRQQDEDFRYFVLCLRCERIRSPYAFTAKGQDKIIVISSFRLRCEMTTGRRLWLFHPFAFAAKWHVNQTGIIVISSITFAAKRRHTKIIVISSISFAAKRIHRIRDEDCRYSWRRREDEITIILVILSFRLRHEVTETVIILQQQTEIKKWQTLATIN